MGATRIVIFAKAPVPGKVKTRLIPALGAIGAAKLAARMLGHIIKAAIEANVGTPELCATPSPDAPEWLAYQGHGIRMTDQGSGDLGERLARAASRVLADGDAILLVGADCPQLDADRLASAARILDTHDAVVLPAHDGGYVLLGLKRFDASIFAGIAWSTDAVLPTTLLRLRELGWSVHIGDMLHDVDEPADLSHAEMFT